MLPETCRVVITIKLEFSASVGFIHKDSVTMHGQTIVKSEKIGYMPKCKCYREKFFGVVRFTRESWKSRPLFLRRFQVECTKCCRSATRRWKNNGFAMLLIFGINMSVLMLTARS
jgi:hypothetical protein